jgi:hypothetical protein
MIFSYDSFGCFYIDFHGSATFRSVKAYPFHGLSAIFIKHSFYRIMSIYFSLTGNLAAGILGQASWA